MGDFCMGEARLCETLVEHGCIVAGLHEEQKMQQGANEVEL
jgi:hypothetical protein